MAAAQMATNMNPGEVEVITSACNDITLDVMSRLGFKFYEDCIDVSEFSYEDIIREYEESGHIDKYLTQISATKLILVPAVSVVHPLFFKWYRDRIDIPKLKRDKIIFIPRGEGFGGGDSRIIGNILDLANSISVKNKVYVHREGIQNLNDLINIFAQAKMIIGPHGGAFYNQFFAQSKIDIIEMIPMMKNGMYPNQISWDGNLPFAHLAMHTNSLLQDQRFHRYITFTDKLNYDINISDFNEWFKKEFPV